VLELHFAAEVIHWRGPAPFFFARLPQAPAAEIARVKRQASYGWGVIPVEATIGGVRFSTSLFPRENTYLLPLKEAVRGPLGVTAGDIVEVEMLVGWREPLR
jgi:hypothetical protein